MYRLFNLFVIHRKWLTSGCKQCHQFNVTIWSGKYFTFVWLQLSHNTLTGWQTNIHGFLFVSTEGNLRAAPLLPPLRRFSLWYWFFFLHKESPGLLWSGDCGLKGLFYIQVAAYCLHSHSVQYKIDCQLHIMGLH